MLLLRGFLCRAKLLGPSLFCGSTTRLSATDDIPPSERTRVIANKFLVVHIMMIGTRPER